MSRKLPVLLAALSAALLCAACGDAEPGLQVQRDTVGDTIIVRTLSGSAWGAPATLEPEVRIGVFEGEDHYMFGNVRALAVAPDGSVYVVDSQVPALRKYGPDGTYLATFGREGGGPGEYAGPDGGLAVMDDGRVILRDPSNARMQVYSAEGEPLSTWPIRGNFNTSNPLVAVDSAGLVYSLMVLNPTASFEDWEIGVVGYDTETGEPADTVDAPSWDYEAPQLVAQHDDGGGTSTSISDVPFSPGGTWAFSPQGYMVGGLSTRYAVEQFRHDGTVLRVEREYEPVPIAPGERRNAEDQVRWDMRQTQPDWTWNGPRIPDEKPPYGDLFAGLDGRIWVLVSTPGERIPDDEVLPPGDGPNPQPPSRWREPVAFDVFEPDGAYLGRVVAPRGFSRYATPVFDGDNVWAVVRDELDVPYVMRFRVAVPGQDGDR